MSSSPVERVLDKLANVKEHQRPDGTKYHTANCPAHDDRHPSLEISEGKDGRALLICRAGCTTDQIVAAIGSTLADLFAKKDAPIRVRRKKGGRVLYPPKHTINTAMQSERLTISAAPSPITRR